MKNHLSLPMLLSSKSIKSLGSVMRKEIDKILEFRLEQSREKLKLSRVKLEKNLFNDSIAYAYLSMFYAARVLLIDKDEDADDYDRIMDLIDKYYEPSGWTTVNIPAIMKETRDFKDKVESLPGQKAEKADAERFYNHALVILNEVEKGSTIPR